MGVLSAGLKKKLSFSGDVGPLEHVAVIPKHPAVGE